MATEAQIILRMTEKRSTSLYKRFWHLDYQQDMQVLLDSTELDLTQKFTAVLAAFAQLKFPLKLSDFRSAIPDAFWSAHVHFHFTRYLGGAVPIFCGEGEWFYNLILGPRTSRYGSHKVIFCASSGLLPPDDS